MFEGRRTVLKELGVDIFGVALFLFALEGGQDFMPENTLRAYHYGHSANNREIPRIAGVKCCLPHFCAFLLRFS